jgi:hypothetical protein
LEYGKYDVLSKGRPKSRGPVGVEALSQETATVRNLIQCLTSIAFVSQFDKSDTNNKQSKIKQLTVSKVRAKMVR